MLIFMHGTCNLVDDPKMCNYTTISAIILDPVQGGYTRAKNIAIYGLQIHFAKPYQLDNVQTRVIPTIIIYKAR